MGNRSCMISITSTAFYVDPVLSYPASSAKKENKFSEWAQTESRLWSRIFEYFYNKGPAYKKFQNVFEK